MNILLVYATKIECNPIVEIGNFTLLSPYLYQGKWSEHTISVLITGIGAINTALRLAPIIAQNHYDKVIQLGIAGSYSDKYRLGSVVEVIQENYADLGAEDAQGQFLDLKKLGFPSLTTHTQEIYFNSFRNAACSKADVPKVISNTVNLCSGTVDTIQKRLQTFPADIENMEGAAFFQTCIAYRQPFYAFRTISNYVQSRDTSKWNIPLAIEKLTEFTQHFLFNGIFEK